MKIVNQHFQSVSSTDTNRPHTHRNNSGDFSKLMGNMEDDIDYDNILAMILDNMTISEQDAHIKTLEQLKKDGYEEDDLKFINATLLKEKANQDTQLNQEEENMMSQYRSIFKRMLEAIQESFDKDLKMREFRTKMMIEETILKTTQN